MKTIKLEPSVDKAALVREASKIILSGSLVALPCTGKYRIVADLTNPDAVIALMQSKRRVKRAPALIFVDSETMLSQIADRPDALALALVRHFWPQLFTVRVRLRDDLPNTVRKQLGGSKSKVGVRVPGDGLANDIVRGVARPLLVSSANPEKKSGATSPAQVRKNFAGKIDLFVDAGDLQPMPDSTVVEVADGEIEIVRQGAITEDMLRNASSGLK